MIIACESRRLLWCFFFFFFLSIFFEPRRRERRSFPDVKQNPQKRLPSQVTTTTAKAGWKFIFFYSATKGFFEEIFSSLCWLKELYIVLVVDNRNA